ncbi:MAG: BatA and WFA domain-containing protein [Nanoarchaeota archaeon]|nr:BatA and WFA domain-containing protein [Nanoarchaeota archaeon]
MALDNITGLYALAAIVPFIIIYLIKPRHYEQEIPSLMFIMNQQSKSKATAFLKKWLKNLLFFIQLFAILGLALAAAEPWFTIPHTVLINNAVIVLDGSASMLTSHGSSTRFDQAVDEAKKHLGLKNTIIFATDIPLILVERGSRSEALEALRNAKAKASGTNIGDAIVLADDLIGNEKAVVTILSDFIATGGSDMLLAKQTLISKGNAVNIINIYEPANNIGIVGLEVDLKETIATIRSYQDKPVTTKLKVKHQTTTTEKIINLQPFATEKMIISTPVGTSTLTLDHNDDLAMDNEVYISTPTGGNLEVLLITSYPDQSKIKSALQARSDITVEVRQPPTINVHNLEKDVVIINDIDPDLFVPTDFRDMNSYVEKGGTLIITSQQELDIIKEMLDKQKVSALLPITLQEYKDAQTTVCVDLLGKIFNKDPFADEPCFSTISSYWKANFQNATITLASTKNDNTPMVVTSSLGGGNVIYYGIIDNKAGFYNDPFYPIFWNNLINTLLGTESIQEFNKKSGEVIAIGKQTVKTPTFITNADTLFLDEVGFYELNNKKIAVNLLNADESNVGREPIKIDGQVATTGTKATSSDRFDFALPLLTLALFLLILESVILKRRGDL